MSILVVDDERRFFFDAEYARTLYDAHRLLLGGREWDQVWLDFDMGSGVTTQRLVREVAQMAAQGIVLPVTQFVVHTGNPVGRTEIHQCLDAYYELRDADAARFLKDRAFPS